eukprot:15467401-Alexandrium_andersonii.AAC.1
MVRKGRTRAHTLARARARELNKQYAQERDEDKDPESLWDGSDKTYAHLLADTYSASDLSEEHNLDVGTGCQIEGGP